MQSFRLGERKRLLLLGDLFFVNLATVVALVIHAVRTNEVLDSAYFAEMLIWFAFFSVLWLLVSYFAGVYDLSSMSDLGKALQVLLVPFVLIFALYLGVFFFTATGGLLPRGIVIYQSVIGLALLGLWRWAFLTFTQSDLALRRVIIVGAGLAGNTIAQAILEHAERHFRVLGFVDDSRTGTVEVVTHAPVNGTDLDSDHPHRFEVIGRSADLRELVEEKAVSEVIVAITHDIQPEMYGAILDCRELGVQISPMTSLYEYLTGRVPIEHIGREWHMALPLDSSGGGGFYAFANRMFDIVGALLGLAILLPFFPFLALAIYLDSPGPIFYSQVRIGKGGKPFRLLKLRTMVPNAEKAGPQRALEGDPRLTRVGRLLRKVRLDEMPQLFNVLRGEMSAVGPRPERPGHLEELEREIPYHRLRNAVKPGMAGWAAVNYGYIESLEDAKVRLEYDLYYVKHQSMWLDLRVMLKMVVQVFQFRGR